MSAKDGRGGRLCDLADLFECQATPDAGHHDLAQFIGQLAQRLGRVLRDDLPRARRPKPGVIFRGRDGLAPPAPRLGPAIVVGPVPHDPVEPGGDIVGSLRLPSQLDEGLLDDVSRRLRSLGREQLQRSRMRIYQLSQEFWSEETHAAAS
jgi:hypothetical protein